MSSNHHPSQMSIVYHRKPVPDLSAQQRADVEAVQRDPFQSARARKRAAALLRLTQDGEVPGVEAATTGLTEEHIAQMLRRLETGGVRGALFGVERHVTRRRYDVEAVARALEKIVRSRPPAGIYWSVKDLTDAVTREVPGTAGITSEYVRSIMVRKLGIRSVRHIKPFWLQQYEAARRRPGMPESVAFV